MFINLTERRSFTAEIPGRIINDLEIESEWNGLTKFVQPASGLHLIVMRDAGLIVDGSSALMAELLASPTSTGYIRFPRTVLPCGIVVESFRIMQYMGSIDAEGKAYVSETAKPLIKINFKDSIKACEAAGGQMLRGSQHLTIALDIMNHDKNWTGGKVGLGHVYRGLHKNKVSGAQANNYESSDQEERRWHVLSTGDRIYDWAGHLFSWMVNDLPGNVNGLAGIIHADSPYLTTGSQFTQAQGAGWRPDDARDWSGDALRRGGCWHSGSGAGAFALGSDWPDNEVDGFGFRCTLP